MKKLLFFIGVIFLLAGCDYSMLTNTPTKQVEIFLNKYQALDSDVINDLDNVVNNEVNFTAAQKDQYRDLMKKHYQNLIYDIKDETVDGDKATVKTEIEVTDFSQALATANTYLEQHPSEFNDANGNYDVTKFNDYRLNQLKDVKKTVKYTIDFSLTKVNDKWRLDPLDLTDQDKINGIYIY